MTKNEAIYPSPRSSFLKQKLPTITQATSDQEEEDSKSNQERNRRRTAFPATSDHGSNQDAKEIKTIVKKTTPRSSARVPMKTQNTIMKIRQNTLGRKTQKDQEQIQKSKEQDELERTLQSIENINKQRVDRANTRKKIQMYLNKYRDIVRNIVENPDKPENQQILKEAEQIGIKKVYTSFKNQKDIDKHERHKHGLPLYFYLRRKIFEQQYQDFLVLVRKGNFSQAYDECAKPAFRNAFDYQIKNMMVFEEFFKKNEFNIPKKLLELYSVKLYTKKSINLNNVNDKQRYKMGANGFFEQETVNCELQSNKSRKIDESFYQCGYAIKKDYLFDFVKKMVMLSNLSESEFLLKELLKQQDTTGKALVQASVQFSLQIHKKHQKSLEQDKFKMERNIQNIMNMEFKQRFESKDNHNITKREYPENKQHESFNETLKPLKGNLVSLIGESLQKQLVNKSNTIQPELIMSNNNNNDMYNINNLDSFHYQEEKLKHMPGSANDILKQLMHIQQQKHLLHDQKSFYNKRVLQSIIEHGFYDKDDESILLALYLLCHQEKRADKCIELILSKGGAFKNQLNNFDSESKDSIVEQLVDMMSEQKIIRKVVREAIIQNEAEIAIMAGQNLRQEQVGEDQIVQIIDYANLIENLRIILENDRISILNKKRELKDQRKSMIQQSQIIKKYDNQYGQDVNKELNEEQKKLQFLESNRKYIIEERSLELKERLQVQQKKNIIKTMIKYLKYFIKSDYRIEDMSVNTFLKLGNKKLLNKGNSIILYDGLNFNSNSLGPRLSQKSGMYDKNDSNHNSNHNLLGKTNIYGKDVQSDDCPLERLGFLTIMQRTLELKKHLEQINPLGFEIEYFLRKLLIWEMKQFRKLKIKDEIINNYCFRIIRESVINNKPFIAEMVLHLRKKINTENQNMAIMTDENTQKILDDDQCQIIFELLLENPNCEKLELILEIMELNQSSKKILKNIYSLIVASEDDHTNKKIIQEKRSLLIEGKYIYYCAEILAQTDVKDLEQHYSKEIALNLVKFCKSNELKYCHSPYLSLILIAEFVKRLSKADVLHSNILTTTLNQILELALCFQKSIKNEKKFKYIHQKKDLRNREVLDIIVENQFYELLENDDIGMIAEDLWKGNPAYSIWRSSSIRQFIQLEVFDDQIQLFKKLNSNQRYIFQFDNWKQSCLHRYIAEAFSIFMLAIFYQIIVYIQISNNTIDDNNKDYEVLSVQTLAQIWIYSAFSSQIMQLIYSLKTSKKFQIDWWRFVDLLLCIMCIIDSLRIHIHFYPPRKGEITYKSIDIEDPDIEVDNNVYNRHILNSSIISIIVFLIWIRIISVLITTKQLGHMIQAIYFMIKMTLNFLIIFACWLICSSAIFTAIYYDSGSSDDSYRSFSVTVTTLFSAALAVYDDKFTILEPLGSILISIYVVISAVMLINLLIALLTEAFEAISKQADSRHRAILINYRHRWSWNESQSYLIFLPPPLNIIAIPLIPFGLFMNQKKMAVLNNFFCKTMFFIVYVIPMIIVFFMFNLIILIFAWFKGFYTIRSLIYKNQLILNLVIWSLFGIFILIGVIFKDIYCIIHIAIESLAFRRNKKGKQQRHFMEMDRLKLKQEKENVIYSNFIKSVINLFEEFDFQSEGSLSGNNRRSTIQNYTPINAMKRNTIQNNNQKYKQMNQDKFVEIRIFASRFYRLLEDKEINKRDVKNPARALKGKRKKRPKIFQNFIQENSKEVQVDLMQCYFFKKYRYKAKDVFERAYFADFNAIDKAIHKFRQKSALQKQGQNLKKINESSSSIKDLLINYNSKGNLAIISENLIELMASKIQEAEDQIEERRQRRNQQANIDNDDNYSHRFTEESNQQNDGDNEAEIDDGEDYNINQSFDDDDADESGLSKDESDISQEEDDRQLEKFESQKSGKDQTYKEEKPPLLVFSQTGSVYVPNTTENNNLQNKLKEKVTQIAIDNQDIIDKQE